MTIRDLMREALFLFIAEDTHFNAGWIDDKEIKAWWKQTKGESERDYSVRRLIPPKKKKDPEGFFGTEVYPNEALIVICQERYPDILRSSLAKVKKSRPDVYRLSLEEALRKVGRQAAR